MSLARLYCRRILNSVMASQKSRSRRVVSDSASEMRRSSATAMSHFLSSLSATAREMRCDELRVTAAAPPSSNSRSAASGSSMWPAWRMRTAVKPRMAASLRPARASASATRKRASAKSPPRVSRSSSSP